MLSHLFMSVTKKLVRCGYKVSIAKIQNVKPNE